jgi:hypothetical protein
LNVQVLACTVVGNYEVRAELIKKLIDDNITSERKRHILQTSTLHPAPHTAHLNPRP